MTVGLVMIVRNESAILPRLADSVRDHIDYWTVVDTGSTDDTLEVLDRIFTPVPGQVIEHMFDGFGPTRNIALRAAEPHCDWMLCLDADETFHGSLPMNFDAGVESDCLEAEQHNGSMRFWLPRMLRSNRGWESRGRAHEYYVSPIAKPPMKQDWFYVEHHGDGSDRINKFTRDIDLLTRDWNEDETNGRAAFYLARTFQDFGQLAQAVYWYRKRLALPGWIEETFYARYCLGMCLLDMGAMEEGCGHLWHAWAEQPQRAEPLVALASYYRARELWFLAYEAAELAFEWCFAQPGNMLPHHDGLFVDTTAVGWRAAYEQSVSAFYMGRKERGKTLTDWLLTQDLPEPYASSVRANMSFYE